MKFCKSVIAFIIDATLSFSLFQIVALILAYFYFISFFPAFFIIWYLYYCFCFLLRGTTLGLAFFGSVLKDYGAKSGYIIRVILRESLTSFPAVVLWLLLWDSIPLLRISLMAIICLILTIIRKRIFKLQVHTENEMKSSLEVRAVTRNIRSQIVCIYALIIVLGVSCFCLNAYLTGDRIIMDENPIALHPRPSAHSVNKYTDYLNNNRKDINEYIQELFQEYDHVVICERWHPEMTQYDMIYNLVTSPYFADSIGNVFTEIGDVESRDAFRQLTVTTFPTDSAREKALTSFLMDNQTVWVLWSHTNWFNFLKKMSVFNHGRNKPVNILFSDILWTDSSKLPERDSIMASNIINTIHTDSIKKSLVIMNYRHAFMTSGNCGSYIQKAFPGKVANVLLNSFRFSICQIPSPIQHGKWDVAAEQIDEDGFAIDFQGSPFGNDFFDFSPVASLGFSKNVKYSDMFTGMIYYKSPAQQYIEYGFPYLFTPENQSKLKTRTPVMPGDKLSNSDFLRSGNVVEKGANYIENYIYNFLYVFLFSISLILLLGMSIATARSYK